MNGCPNDRPLKSAAGRALRVALLAVVLLGGAGSCMSSEPSVMLNGSRFTVEVAATPEDRTLGLMFRESLPDDHGMLFVFGGEATRSFWMKNTRIPLDIFFFDSDLRLVSVSEHARPCRAARCPSYRSTGPAKYVLELNAGKAAELGVAPGDRLELRLD